MKGVRHERRRVGEPQAALGGADDRRTPTPYSFKESFFATQPKDLVHCGA